MPTVSVLKEEFFQQLGKNLNLQELQDLCFDFGVEYDGTELNENKEELIRIEIPANRYDLLSLEGLVVAFKCFKKEQQTPDYRLEPEKTTNVAKLKVQKENSEIRPYIHAAILRDVELDENRYKSLIDLQEKLHQNLCRRRTIAAIGTHDLDTVTAPFTYTFERPDDVVFVPLTDPSREYKGSELMEVYSTHPQLKNYSKLLKGAKYYPVVRDSNRNVCSLPPVINSNKTKITLKTKNIFVEVTSTDRNKGSIVINQLVAAFSKYCKKPYTVEPVLVEYESPVLTPDLSRRRVVASVPYLSKLIGIEELTAELACELLSKMMVTSRVVDSKTIEASVPITRSDIQHPCDLGEDIAIAYGYDKIKRKNFQMGKLMEKTLLSDKVKFVFTSCSYKETLMPVLDSFKNSYQNMCWEVPGDEGPRPPVVLHNTRLSENETLRTSLIPGLLKTVQYKKGSNLPIRVFEVGEVVWREAKSEVGAVNNTNCACAYADSVSGLEEVQGVSEHLLNQLGFVSEYQVWEQEEFKKPLPESWKHRYKLEEKEDPAFLTGRSVLFVRTKGGGETLGVMGIVHPNVLKNFHINFPVSLFELDLTLIQKIMSGQC